MKKFSVLFSIAFFYAQVGLPCSSFFIPNAKQAIFTKSYDWHMGQAHVTVNKRNVMKSALQFSSKEASLRWTSKFGSVTFNQYGHEFPLGGMNEKGLAIEILWLEGSVYPEPDDRHSLNELQWIQYHLDTAKDVSELIQKAKNLRVTPVHAAVHYLACDVTRKCASFEYLGGKLVIHSNLKNNLPVRSITNNTYKQSSRYIKNYQGFGGKRNIPRDRSSLSRFVRGSSLAQNFRTQQSTAVDYAFTVLDSVAAKGSYSKWNIVYNLDQKTVYFKTRFGDTSIKKIKLNDFDYSCKKPVKYLDIEYRAVGQVAQAFKDYNFAANKSLVSQSMTEFPEYLKAAVYNYPRSTHCTE